MAQESGKWVALDVVGYPQHGALTSSYMQHFGKLFDVGVGVGLGNFFEKSMDHYVAGSGETLHIETGGIYVPLFADAKFKFWDAKVALFLRMQLGGAFHITKPAVSLYAVPMFGIDIKRLTLSFGIQGHYIYSDKIYVESTNEMFPAFISAPVFNIGWKF